MARITIVHPTMAARQLFEVSKADKPTIKILLYTDAPRLVTRSRAGMFGLGQMIQHLQGHAPAFARLDIQWKSRYLPNSPQAVNKLDAVLKTEFDTTGDHFDQIWFFGVHQISKTQQGLGIGGGTLESELTADEVNALTTWMEDQQGGVLVTGDHANRVPVTAIINDPRVGCPDENRKEEFLSLGRALGRCVPRAGLLRDWEGDPTGDPQRSHNTHAAVLGVPIEDAGLQRDGNPQQIFHGLFDANGQPAENGDPHPLFFYRDKEFIQFLPDHMHEGSVMIPTPLDKNVWKANALGFRPEPHIIATGMDSRRRSELGLLAAYDGTALNWGRIVVDSSWHHYFNINLENFRFPEAQGSPGDQIGQFYANLAIWLSPIAKRRQMAESMTQWLADQPVVLEGFGPSPAENPDAIRGTGSAALAILKRIASPCEIHELLQMTLAPERREKVETHYFPDTQSALDGLPSKTMLLGYVVNRLAVSIDEFPDPALSNKDGIANTSAVDLVGASERAFGRQRVQVNRALRSAEKLSARSSSKARAEFRAQTPAKTSMPPDSKEKELKASTTVEEGLERSTTMKACENIDWDIILHIDSDPDPENTETIGFRHVEITNGIITGNVEDEGGEFLSVLRGTCTPSVVAGQPDMSQMNFVFTLRDNEEELFLLLLDGIAYPNPNTGRGEFHGQFRAYVPFGDTLLSPLINPASPGPPPGHLEDLDFDEGDTGTGNGTQT